MVNSILMISLSCLFIGFSSLWTSHGAALSKGDTLRPGERLTSSTFLVSPSGEFRLGFNSGYLILRSKHHTVWVANPDSPISDTSTAYLGISFPDLQIWHKGRTGLETIVLYSSPGYIRGVVASLTDSGTLVLHQNSTSVSQQSKWWLWQSSDNSTVALMPGGKLGSDKRNKKEWSLHSWVESQNRPGSFILRWNILNHQLQISRGEVLLWTSGEFIYGSFSYFYAPSSSFNLSVVSNKNEDYFSYSAVGNQNVRPIWVLLDTDGELYDVENNVSIVRAGECDGYNTDLSGCQRWSGRATDHCPRAGEFQVIINGFSFKPMSTKTSMNSTWVDTTQSRSGIEHCKATCWLHCDCLGFEFLFDNQTGCQFWSVKYSQFLEDPDSSGTKYIIPRTVSTKLPPKNNDVHALRKWIGIATGIAAFLLVLVLCSLWYLIQKRKLAVENQTKIQDMLNMMNSNRPANANGLQSDGKRGHDLSVFKYSSVMAATCNFSVENKVGEGGFGAVYKGKLVSGKEIAVKRLSKCSGQGISEFKNELILIYELQHTNLVQLFGFCIHGEERMLIYEYMPNKSLDYFLFDSTRSQQLDWKKRFGIIEGIAQGLLYLHKYSRLKIIHRDLKASNVLLDENMNPKISDFGMARIFGHDEQEANTMKIVGTRGYMSPEYVMGGNFSTKSDVYSFGVLMLEILSGRKNNSFYDDDRAINLVDYAWALWKGGAGLELVDPTLSESCDKDQLLRCIDVGLLCVEENAASRPTMLEVMPMLTNESLSLPAPTKPAFCTQTTMTTAAVGGNGSKMVPSVNGITNSDFDGR